MGSPWARMASTSIIIDTKDAVRTGVQPCRAARSTLARVAEGRVRGVFMGCGRPSVQRTADARTTVPRGAAARARSSSSSAGGSGTVSSSISHTSSASWADSARSMPAVNPPAPPVFVGSVVSATSGNRARMTSADPSVDALSMTTTSCSGTVCAASAASVSTTSSRRFQATTTATTRGGSPVIVRSPGGGARRGGRSPTPR
ncbi:hypothetical protein CMMCAS05_07640 [Clavibacter michiganensis subsp. michiganensis]|nr:hypothetical protein CMMCAS05_07640 [Clavibacter michiganensis subsp. michiganensis]